ncbi:MAG: START domain-containing protein [Polyangia bacterium]
MAAARMFAAAAWIASLGVAGGARGDEAWRVVHERSGVTLERRAVEGSRYYEYRARAHTTVSAPAALMRIWSGIGDERSPTVKHRTVLFRAEDELVVYDQIHAAVVSDRDVIIRIRKSGDGRGGFDIAFESTASLGPPPAAGYVRLPMVRGSWRIEPAPDGGATIAYRCYSEPGGAIPAFLVRGAQQDSTLDEFERVLTRVGR